MEVPIPVRMYKITRDCVSPVNELRSKISLFEGGGRGSRTRI
jgi:hypothetical protein